MVRFYSRAAHKNVTQVTSMCSLVKIITVETIVTEPLTGVRATKKAPELCPGLQLQAAFAGDGGKYCLGIA